MKTIFLAIGLIATSCASLDKSISVGGAIGAASGLATGYLVNFNTKGMALTTITGAALGAVAGYLLHPSQKRVSELPSLSDFRKEFPTLNESRVESLWIPDRIEESRFIEGHWIHEIQNPTQWNLEQKGETEDGQVQTKK